VLLQLLRRDRSGGELRDNLDEPDVRGQEGAEGGIESVTKNAPIDARYERKTSTSGYPYFVLKAANGEALGKSETYSSTAAMENGIESVKKNAPDAKVDDLT
jgi:uncharacterized protein